MTADFDVVVIGGGHNGLVTANYLARAGQRVLVVEARAALGGTAATEEVFPGFLFDTGASHVGLLNPKVLRELELHAAGLELIDSPISILSLEGDAPLRLWKDPDAARREIEKRSPTDAVRYSEFLALIEAQTMVLREAFDRSPPELGSERSLRGLLPWSSVALRLKRNGRKAVSEFLRNIPIPVEQLLDEWFEDELLKGALATSGVEGTMQGPKASGTGLMFLYQAANGFPPPVRYVRGGTGALARVLAEEAANRGIEVRTGVRVERIRIDEYRATGVTLSDGQEVRCGAIASSANPRHTLLDLAGASNLEIRVMRRARNIRFRGSTAKVNLALDRLPDFVGVNDPSDLSGRILISPSTEYLERAYDDAKYGSWSQSPYLDMTIPTLMDESRAPQGKHVLSVVVRYAPFDLGGRGWDREREAFGDHIVSTLARYAPNLPNSILHRQVLTPLDYEREYGLAEGSIYHGQMAIDQMLLMRPIPGYGRYRSPIEGLFFCGAGSHPGGGVTGAPGRNAAREILKAL